MNDRELFHIHQLHYKDVLKIDDLSIPSAVITCIVGESGSGKTTLLKLLNHLISPDSGEIIIEGRPVFEWNPLELRREIVMMAQTPVMFGGTVRDDLLVGLRFSEKPGVADARLKKILHDVHLDKALDAESDSLSGGEKQRLSLARILLLDPPVLLLDEPSSALDEENTRFIMKKLAGFVKSNKKTLVMITHSTAVVREFADHVIEINNGQVVRESEPIEQR
ncbi:ABC transporter ATP-binding protein [Sporolactobacillus sp. CQH2019]|uniref:ABC transporter ATP-binding protein n=1 Tax=Sporolactobacillus sp. CQH2019 TaxID=3023512 RepID=UPI0023685721|nr:ABC transporter ATP-binding protein [Sporolactobacillus sp. CQH2019]MDD9148675.1 ABC transporter ATP-binding protein [Sporolactobacillus sp. CQH2019]